MIIRVEKVIKDTIILHKYPICIDVKLSWKAKGILTYLLGHGDNWECSIEDVIDHASDGASAVKAGLKELQQYGYAEKKALRDSQGHFSGWAWTIYELPKVENQLSEKQTENIEKSPKVENQPSGMPKVENQPSGKTPQVENQLSEETPKNTRGSPKVENRSPKVDFPKVENRSQRNTNICNVIKEKEEKGADAPETPITIFRSVFHFWPNKEWQPTFLQHITDLKTFREVCVSWTGNPKNYKGLLDKYRKAKGVPLNFDRNMAILQQFAQKEGL